MGRNQLAEREFASMQKKLRPWSANMARQNTPGAPHKRPAEFRGYERRLSMETVFPDPIMQLPEAEIPIEGIKAYLSQAENHQLIFMQFEKDVDLPEHSHAAQVGFVLRGKIELIIDGVKNEYKKGDIYFIPENIRHSGRIFAGYADITFFNEPDRYQKK